MEKLKSRIEEIIIDKIEELNRPDLFRAPIFGYSMAEDSRYGELKEIIGDWHKTPNEMLKDAVTVISYFVPFTREVARAPMKQESELELWGKSYLLINDWFDEIGKEAVNELEACGHTALAIAGTHNYDPKDLKAFWSHRSAAAIGGLGTFGANRMLITEKGSAGRFCTILTSAKFEPEEKTALEYCIYNKSGKCGLCFKHCPAEAITETGFDRFGCHDQVLMKNVEKLKHIGYCDVCGICISVCPFAYLGE